MLGLAVTAAPLRIAAVRPASAQEWDTAWAATPSATFSMSREWADWWCGLSDGTLESAPLHVEFGDGASAVLPLVARRQYKGLLRDYELCAGGGYGAALSADELAPEHHRLLVEHLLSLRDVSWLTSPLDSAAALRAVEGQSADSTHLLALEGSMDDIVKRWSKGARAATKQAQRCGVRVRQARTHDDWRAYFVVYQDSLRRWGERATSNHGWPVFEHLVRMDPAQVRLWLAELDGEVVAGAVCLYARRHVAYWHGAALEARFQARPVNALIAAAVEDALGSGRRWFDFGLSGGHEGVAAFKRGFGAEAVACYRLLRRSSTHRLVKRVMSRLVGG